MNFTQQMEVSYSKNRLQYMKLASRKTMKTTPITRMIPHYHLIETKFFLLSINKSLAKPNAIREII